MTDPTTALELRGLTKSFGEVRAVDDVDLNIGSGEIVAFLGPNGAGKTTTVDMILGLTDPDGGSVSVYGEHPRQAVGAGRVSAVLQTGGLLRDLRVGETVRAIAALHGSGRGSATSPEEAMERTGLADIARRKVGKCSGGEQQRLRYALALLPDPDLIILDEPTTGMDVTTRRAFWDTMRADAAAGRTIVFATHYLAEADEFAERTVLMHHGRIISDGPTDQVRARFGGRTLTFSPPAWALADGGVDSDWLAAVQEALRPHGVDRVEVSAASLEEAFAALTGEATSPGVDDHADVGRDPGTGSVAGGDATPAYDTTPASAGSQEALR